MTLWISLLSSHYPHIDKYMCYIMCNHDINTFLSSQVALILQVEFFFSCQHVSICHCFALHLNIALFKNMEVSVWNYLQSLCQIISVLSNEKFSSLKMHRAFRNSQGQFGTYFGVQFSSVQFSRSVVSDSLRPQESQHARPPCPSPTPRVHSDSPPSSL